MECPDLTTLIENLGVSIENNNCSELRQCLWKSYFKIDEEQLKRLDLPTARSYVMGIYASRGHRRDGFRCGGLQLYFDALSYSVEIRHLDERERIDHLLSRIKHKIEQFRIAMNGGSVGKLEVINKELMLLTMSFPSQESYLKKLFLQSDVKTADYILQGIASAPLEYEEAKLLFLNEMKGKRDKSFDEILDRHLKSLEWRKKDRIRRAAQEEKYRDKKE